MAAFRIGHGYDSHRFKAGRVLRLGGVTIPGAEGLDGHSDADVAAHALIDALFGALAEGDIGTHFPDTDERWRDADSMRLLAETMAIVTARGWRVANADVTVILERPRLRPFVAAMRARLAEALGCAMEEVSVKAKTNEGMDAVGAGVGIAAHGVVLLERRA